MYVMPTLYIIRGVSGSGKSTLTKEIQSLYPASDRPIVCSTDDFFITKNYLDGKPPGYHFDGDLLHVAHKWNLGRAIRAMRNRRNVIIDNTNTEPWQYAKYVDFAKERDYNVVIEDVHGEVSEETLHEFHERCVHGVPFSTIEGQYKKLMKTHRKEAEEAPHEEESEE